MIHQNLGRLEHRLFRRNYAVRLNLQEQSVVIRPFPDSHVFYFIIHPFDRGKNGVQGNGADFQLFLRPSFSRRITYSLLNLNFYFQFGGFRGKGGDVAILIH